MHKIKSKIAITVLSSLLIFLIGWIDRLTGYEISFSIFYLFPLILLAKHKAMPVTLMVIAAMSAAITWLVADIAVHPPFSSEWIPYWNALVRFGIYLVVVLTIRSIALNREKLKEKSEALARLNEEKNKYFGIAAHDLKNPISAIFSFSQILMRDKEFGYLSESKQEIIKMINRITENSLGLIGNMLDISKIENGSFQLKLNSQNYIEFIKSCIAINQVLANKKGISIELETSPDTLSAEFDKVYMDEAVNNLLSNAIKYSYPGNTVKVRVRKEQNKVFTEIEDFGVGIRQHELKNLFKPFQRTSAKPTSNESSTGLGLAVVQKVIRLHNGEVGVRSQLDNGSVFYFSFPVRQFAAVAMV